jgi:hypothetical protein
MTIKLKKTVGSFAENKDLAREIRLKKIEPVIEKGGQIELDFSGIESATQSFIHALISDLFRKHGNDVLDQIVFKSCNETVKQIIKIVTEYMQES